MTIAQLCLLVACVLPVVCAGLAKSKGFGRRRREGGFDNHRPREWLARQEGWQARANAAQASVDALALGFIAARLAFITAYLADRASLRSLLWMAGLAASVALFFVR